MDKKDHWIFKLEKYDDCHPLKQVINDFGSDSINLFLTSYLYLGKLSDNRRRRKTIAILHYHTSLEGPIKFMDMQNLNCYENFRESLFSKQEFLNLCCNVTSETVINLSFPNALTEYELNKVNEARYFLLCNEKGEIVEYEWEI